MSKTQKHLAIFLAGLYDGGAERITLNLAEGLTGRGYVVDLVLAEAVGPYLTEIPESVRLVVLNTRRRRSARTLASLPALVRYLKRERPLALLSALNYANIVALWAWHLAALSSRLPCLSNIPCLSGRHASQGNGIGTPRRIVIAEHNTFSIWNQQLPAAYRWLFPQLIRSFYPLADDIVAVSKGTADDLAQVTGLSRERIRVIYNPVVTPELCRKAHEPLEHPWFVAGHPDVVLATGRLTAQKDFTTLIRAFCKVREVYPVRLLILGEGEDRPALEALIGQLGLEQEVSLPGFVANPYAFMAHASLFALSSRWEGLPTVLIEALYCGLRVVATDCPSGPREILQGGRYGQLVPVGDVDALAQAIERALAGQIPVPGCESWTPFELERVVDQYVDVLLEG
jgi:glycosyltransferase involved in cell wall biosynthesis